MLAWHHESCLMAQQDSLTIMDWFRSYHGAPTDAKYLMLAKRAGVAAHEVAFVWWAFLDYASQNEPRGSIKGFDPEALACFSGLDESKIRAIEGVCREKGMIDQDDMLSAWQRRQPKREDDSSGRVRAFRERQKGETQGNAPVTQCNDRTEQNREEQKEEGAEAPPPRKTSEPKKRASKRCPTDFEVTSELREWARNNYPGVNLDRETAKFRDHEYKAAKVDWPAAWRTWISKAEEFSLSAPPRANGSHEQRRHKPFGG
jgi:hypothetical protein